MKRLLSLVVLTLTLAACVDTTGISADWRKQQKGNPLSVISVIEYGDLQCPACRTAHTTITQPLLEKYGTQIRFEFRHFPLRSLHRYAMDLAEASECVADQGKFWEYLDVAYEKQDDLKSGSAALWGETLV